MDSRKFILRKTAIIAAGQAVCVAIMIGVFYLLGYYNRSVLLGGIFGGKLRCGGKIQLIPIEEVLDGPTDRRIDNIELDGPCQSENEYMKRYSAANYAHRIRGGLER